MSLRVMSEFDLAVDGAVVRLPHSVERVLAYLALARGDVARTMIAGMLWFDAPDQRAQGNLRTALWRLSRIGCPVVRARGDRIALDTGVKVDIDELLRLGSRIITQHDRLAFRRLPELISGFEILPTWSEDWLIGERERYRQMRLHALESASEELLADGEFGRAIEAALAAVDAEPFRESARRLIVRIHLREGNVMEALRQYGEFRSLISLELGIEPSRLMEDLIAPILPAT